MTVWKWDIQNHIWNKNDDVGSCSTPRFAQHFICTIYIECFWVISCSIGFQPWRQRQNLTGYLLDKGCQCSRNDENSTVRKIKPDLTPSVELPISIGHHYNIGIWFSIVTSMARPGLVKQSLILWTRQKLSTVARLTFWMATAKNMKNLNHWKKACGVNKHEKLDTPLKIVQDSRDATAKCIRSAFERFQKLGASTGLRGGFESIRNAWSFFCGEPDSMPLSPPGPNAAAANALREVAGMAAEPSFQNVLQRGCWWNLLEILGWNWGLWDFRMRTPLYIFVHAAMLAMQTECPFHTCWTDHSTENIYRICMSSPSLLFVGS